MVSKMVTYSSLSGCFFPPDDNLKELVEQFLHAASSWVPEVQKPLELMLDELSNEDYDHLEMMRDYSRLFLGPFEMLAPPFGSVYLGDGKKMVMDETAVEVVQMYREAGLDVKEGFNNPVDHITAELEFMHFLYHQEQSALSAENSEQAAHYGKYRQKFFTEHLGEWGLIFAKKIEQHAQMGFYKNLGRVTAKVLLVEAENYVSAVYQ